MHTLSRYAGYRRFLAAAAAVALIAGIATPAGAHHGKGSLSGHGTMTISDPMTCGPDNCYTVSLDFPPTGSQQISVTATGQAMTDPGTCKKHGGASCCVTVMTLSLTFDQGGGPVAGIDCAFAGKECDKPASSPTSASFKGALECTNGTGQLAGDTAKGKLSGKVSTGTGEGPVSASLKFK